MEIIIDYGTNKQVIRRSNDFATRKTIVINRKTMEAKTFISMAQASRAIGHDDRYIVDKIRHHNGDKDYLFIVGDRKAW